jgi:hypothetical protein
MALQLVHALDAFFCYGFLASLGVCGVGRLAYFYFVWNRAHSVSPDEYRRLQKHWPKHT